MKTYHETLYIDQKGNMSERFDFDGCISINVAKFNYSSEKRRAAQSASVRQLLESSLHDIYKDRVDNSWTLNKFENGKPYLNGNDAPSISFSHSRDWCACAVGNASYVGVDMEVIKTRSWEAYSIDIFHPEEAKWIFAVSGRERDIRALICWCRKEAILKAMGLGLTVTLSEVALSSEGQVIKFPEYLGDPSEWGFFSRVIMGELVIVAAWKN